MKKMTKTLEDKSFLAMAAYAAEEMTEDYIITNLEKSIAKYKKAKSEKKNTQQLNDIYMEISVLSYINVIKMIDMEASTLFEEMDGLSRVFQLIKPVIN